MLDLIIQMLALDNFYGKFKNIDIAKGSNELTTGFRQGWDKIKRKRAWR